MSNKQKKFYLTTPIYYVNARPHIGHAYTTIVADVIARRHRLLGDDTFFLTGTDEHGQKIERSAAAAGIPPQQFADQISLEFRNLWDRMGLTYDGYIRTTDPKHKRGAQKLFAELYKRGQIYLSSYTGQYSIGEEIFVEGPPGTIGPDGKPTETVTEENFFFRLSAYQLPLLNLIESDTLAITPETRKNEVLGFLRGNVSEARQQGLEIAKSAAGVDYVKGALRDLSVSRSSFTWGIPVPEPAASATEKKHVMYVWLDALANYMTAVGYGSDDPKDQAEFAHYWPADVHIMAKEITRQHCVYWPAFLLAAGLALPKAVTAHGWLLFEDSKMSKSRGNIVRTETILDAFGTLLQKPAEISGTSGLSTGFQPGESDAQERGALAPGLSSTEASSAEANRTEAKGLVKGTASAVPQETTGGAAIAAKVSPLPSTPVILSAAKNPRISPEAPQTHPAKHEQDLFASDVLRYFLLREIPFGQDGSFSFDALVQRYNSDLANGYGNLVSRTLSMITKYFDGYLPLGECDGQLSEVANLLTKKVNQNYEANDFTSALANLSALIKAADGFLSLTTPWKLDSSDEEQNEKLKNILYTAFTVLHYVTVLLQPVLPYTAQLVFDQMGIEDQSEQAQLTLPWRQIKLGPLSPIFPRADKGLIQIMTDMEQDAAPKPEPSKLVDEKTTHTTPVPTDPTHPGAAPRTSAFTEENPGATVGGSHALTTERPGTPSHTESPASGPFVASSAASTTPDTPQIAIDDFVKVDLRVAQIVVAERIPKADKLLRLEVDLGYERRQILSGIAEWYTPEELIGRRIIVIANLAPRKMRGLESHGMLLAASTGENSKPILATFAEDI
ncbi:MAG: methionyl-tRNA synthetase, partial [Edaphobacter sp.]|nr:methionyl-tRNA synthetase [Edaphobacter sp.]